MSVPNRKTLFQIAAKAEVDPRTAARYFDLTRTVSDLAAAAIRRALRALRISDPRATGGAS